MRGVVGLEGLALAAYRQLVILLAERANWVARCTRSLQQEEQVAAGDGGRPAQVMEAVVVFVGEVQEYVWSRVVCYLCQQVHPPARGAGGGAHAGGRHRGPGEEEDHVDDGDEHVGVPPPGGTALPLTSPDLTNLPWTRPDLACR